MEQGNLKIELLSTINVGKSIGDINKKIREINKSGLLKPLELKIDIDKNLTESIKKFTTAANQLNKIISDQNKILKTETKTFQDSTGAITQQTKQHLVNGEVITQVTQQTGKLINNQKKEIQTTEELTQRLNQLANARQKSNQTVLNDDGTLNKHTKTFGDDFATLTQTTNKDGKTISVINDNYEKEHQRNLKRIKDIDHAEMLAYQEKQKRETHLHGKRIQDQKLAYDLARIEDDKFNRQRLENEQKFARKQQETLNKLAEAQLKYGHHNKVKEGLVDTEAQIRAITMSQGDWNNSFKNIESNIKKTTSGFKAIRSESIGIAEGMGTALVNILPLSIVIY